MFHNIIGLLCFHQVNADRLGIKDQAQTVEL